MAVRYRQFLGTKPGIVVELVDDSASPYRVRTRDGFEYGISADDFRTYYQKEGDPIPSRWFHLITDPENQTVESGTMAEVMEVIYSFAEAFQDFHKARSFVRDALSEIANDPQPSASKLKSWTDSSGRNPGPLTEKDLERLTSVGERVKTLLLSDSCAVIKWPTASDENGHIGEGGIGSSTPSPEGKTAGSKKKKPAIRRAGMKNVELLVFGEILTLGIDLSKEFGPSKSGKTVIIASSEGNKSVPGREEKIGLNVYRQEGGRAARGRRSSFKNVEMAVEGDTLTITIDLSQELGPSKSGKTIIVASTGGNQLVPGRMEKIGLNVYRKIL